MKYLFALVLLLLLLTGISFADTYTNLIIFGDSQSDIGNMPESDTINPTTQARYYYHGILYNLYIPATNPTVANTNALLANLLDFSKLPAQPPINGKMIREGRSINWSQYLFLALKAKGQLASNSLLPWVSVVNNAARQIQNGSVDYAFAGALSGHYCADEGYLPAPDAICTEANTLQAQNNYRLHPDNDTLRGKVLIPGVQRQIDFFRHDLQTGAIHADTHTLYIIWTGANDLGLNFHSLLQGQYKLFFNNIKTTIPEQTIIAIHQLQQVGARNIIIIGQQNLGLTPEASLLTNTNKHFITRYLNAYLLNILVLQYNLSLTQKIYTLQQQYPQLHIQYVDLQNLFNRLSFLPAKPFFKNLGLACQNRDAATYQAITEGKLINCSDYMYWNRAHMSDATNQWIAKAVLPVLQ